MEEVILDTAVVEVTLDTVAVVAVEEVVDPVVDQAVEVARLHVQPAVAVEGVIPVLGEADPAVILVPEVEAPAVDLIVEVVDPAVDPQIKERRCIFGMWFTDLLEIESPLSNNIVIVMAWR